MSLFVYAGSMQFVAIELLLTPFAPLSAALVTLMVNARHLFMGSPCWNLLKLWESLSLI